MAGRLGCHLPGCCCRRFREVTAYVSLGSYTLVGIRACSWTYLEGSNEKTLSITRVCEIEKKSSYCMLVNGERLLLLIPSPAAVVLVGSMLVSFRSLAGTAPQDVLETMNDLRGSPSPVAKRPAREPALTRLSSFSAEARTKKRQDRNVL